MATNVQKHYATGVGAISVSAPAHPGGSKLNAVLLHLSVGGAAGNLTIKLDSAKGAAYDAVFVTQAMAGLTDYAYIPSNPVVLEEGDAIVVAYSANAGGTTYGLQVILLDI